MLKCNTCGGTYQDTTKGGIAYFHACGPIPNPLYQPDPTKPLFNLQQFIERPNKRDENLLPNADPKLPAIMVSAGTGVTAV
jgi:hypothetical protein